MPPRNQLGGMFVQRSGEEAMTSWRRRAMIAAAPVVAIILMMMFWPHDRSSPDQLPPEISANPEKDGEGERPLSMDQVLEMAREARRHLGDTLKDYTARLVKQEMDRQGVVGPESEMMIKVQSRVRDDRDDAALRVYLRFTRPESFKGRQVIWGEDLYDGKMAVHETGLILGLKTLWLDPTGALAMQGQRYPITQIGLVRLVEQLIERGEKDRDNPDVSVTLTPNHRFDDRLTHLIRVQRSRPSNEPDDFSLAEIVVDPDRQLILAYRSFGWPNPEGSPPPILESYSYHDLKLNVGLTDADFDTKNPEYGFPAF
jgi:hypothetical protein